MEKQAQAQEKEQWHGAVEARLPSTPAAAAWPHVADFFALHRYLPGIDVCERVAAGDDGDDVAVRPGCVRYCASFAPAGDSEAEAEEVVASWAREELVELDARGRRLAYAVVGSNMGFGRYVASMTVLPGGETTAGDDDDHGAGGGGGSAAAPGSGCRLVWAFECEPVQGWSRDGLLGYLDGAVKGMAERIEEEAATGPAAGAVLVAGGGGGGAAAA